MPAKPFQPLGSLLHCTGSSSMNSVAIVTVCHTCLSQVHDWWLIRFLPARCSQTHIDPKWSKIIQNDPIWSNDPIVTVCHMCLSQVHDWWLIRFLPARCSQTHIDPKWSKIIQNDPIWSNDPIVTVCHTCLSQVHDWWLIRFFLTDTHWSKIMV